MCIGWGWPGISRRGRAEKIRFGGDGDGEGGLWVVIIIIDVVIVTCRGDAREVVQ